MSDTNRNLAFLASAATLAAAVLGTAALFNNSKKAPNAAVIRTAVEIGEEYPQEIKDELQSRVRTFFGDDGIKKLNSSFVVVVGLGGVGSHCAHMLARSGVAKIRLIDFDQVTLSSLNRHAVATMGDVGLSKAETMARRLRDIVPWCEVEPVTEMFRLAEADRLLAGKPDFVLDCIDDVATKAELIAYCKKNNLEVFTSMGAGGKADPTRMRISELSNCVNDPLASKIKWKLKKHGIAAEDVMSLFSIEKPIVDLLPLSAEQIANPQDFGNVDYMRIRTIPVLGTSPSIFGQAMASYVLCTLAGKMYQPEALETLSKNLKQKLRNVFQKNELERFKTEAFAINMDEEDIEFVVKQVWGSRCAVTNKRFGGHLIQTMTRWDENQLPTPYNLVLMLQDQAKLMHEKGRYNAFTPEQIQKIERRLAWAKLACRDSHDDSVMRSLVEASNPNATKLLSTSCYTEEPSSCCANGSCHAGMRGECFNGNQYQYFWGFMSGAIVASIGILMQKKLNR